LTFFNDRSFADPEDFETLHEGAAVSFELIDDPVNGSRAVAIEVVPAALQVQGSDL
jgi:cold shock CspA family protein